MKSTEIDFGHSVRNERHIIIILDTMRRKKRESHSTTLNGPKSKTDSGQRGIFMGMTDGADDFFLAKIVFW